MTTSIISVDATISKIQVGGVDALQFTSDTLDLLGGKIIGVAPSMIILTGNSGYGSTNAAVRRWTTPTIQGTDITYADSATLGGSLTINTSGVYAMTYNDQLNALNAGLAITINQTTFSAASPNQPVTSSTMGAGLTSVLGVTMYLAAGSVVRAIGTSPAGATPQYTAFVITRIS